MGGKTDLKRNLNLSGAYRLNDHWSFGLGFDAVYAKRRLSAMRVIYRKLSAHSSGMVAALSRLRLRPGQQAGGISATPRLLV
jgi:long-chain fatty acid transport protein